MSFNNSNGNAGPPCGSIIATLATSDPPGWIIADGVNRTDSTIYNKLIEMSIGTRPTGYYKPPNLKGAFLRAIGETIFNSQTYTGQSSIKTFVKDKFQDHKHTATQDTHSHTNNTVKDRTNANNSLGLGYQDNNNSESDNNNNNWYEHDTHDLIQMKENTTSATPTIEVSNTGDTETAPYCYGVNWAIKI